MTTAKRPAKKGNPDKGKTKVKGIRVSEGLWEAVRVKAEGEGSTRTDAIRDLLLDYVGDPSLSPLAESEMDRRSSVYRARQESGESS